MDERAQFYAIEFNSAEYANHPRSSDSGMPVDRRTGILQRKPQIHPANWFGGAAGCCGDFEICGERRNFGVRRLVGALDVI